MKKSVAIASSKDSSKNDIGSSLAHETSKITNIADSMMEVGQEYTLAIEDVLMNEFGFTEKDLKKLHEKLSYIMQVTHRAEGLGLNAVGIRTMRVMGEIAEIRKKRKELEQTGIALPAPSKAAILEKLLEN